MSCRIEKSKLSGQISCPPNKSYTHRAIMVATLAKQKSLIKNVLQSEDTRASIQACKSFGAKISETGKDLTIDGIKEFPEKNININAKNSGTTIRIAAAMASLFKAQTILTGDESLRKRPMQPLLNALETLGATCSSNNGTPPVKISGVIKGGEIAIAGNISSQFITALMIVAPKTENGMMLNIEGDLVSKPYLDATISLMEKFGVKVNIIIPYKKYQIFSQNYSASEVVIPTDFSSLALLLSASVLIGNELTFQVTKTDLPQGDEKILDILKNLGVEIIKNGNCISTKSPEKLFGGKFDLKNTPDLLPPLAILALKTEKPIEIVNVKHARYKETDRISIIVRELKKLGLRIKEKEDGMILESAEKYQGAKLNSENDHRLFMAFCIAGMFVGNCTVSNPESISISYPNFISDINKVGGNIKSNL